MVPQDQERKNICSEVIFIGPLVLLSIMLISSHTLSQFTLSALFDISITTELILYTWKWIEIWVKTPDHDYSSLKGLSQDCNSHLFAPAHESSPGQWGSVRKEGWGRLGRALDAKPRVSVIHKGSFQGDVARWVSRAWDSYFLIR